MNSLRSGWLSPRGTEAVCRGRAQRFVVLSCRLLWGFCAPAGAVRTVGDLSKDNAVSLPAAHTNARRILRQTMTHAI